MLARYCRSPSAVFGLLLLLAVVGMAATASVFFPNNPLDLAGRPLQWPSKSRAVWLGTDNVGRDIAAQIFHGARTTLAIGLASTAIALGIGVVVGAVSGYFGGWIDEALMRVADAFQILPSFLLLLVLISIFQTSFATVILAIGIVSWPAPARLARGEFLTLRNRDFVDGCRAVGMGDTRIIFTEILPNALPPIIVYASVVMAVAILNESALAFLNLSDRNIASWGNLIGVGRATLRVEWYVSAIPGIPILLTVLAVSLVGQGLNDALNPRLARRLASSASRA